MQIKLVDSKAMTTLEHYVVALVTGLISLRTLEGYHIAAVNLGILKEDQECRANTLVWDIIRLRKLYADQIDAALELLPSDFDVTEILRDLKTKEVKKTKSKSKGDLLSGEEKTV